MLYFEVVVIVIGQHLPRAQGSVEQPCTIFLDFGFVWRIASPRTRWFGLACAFLLFVVKI